jgi:hypothetical protein
MTNYYWNNCYRWSKSSWDKYNALPEDTKRALTEGGEKQDWLLKYEKQLGRLPPWLTQPPKSLQIDCKTGNPIDSDASAVGNSDSSDLLNETAFPWEEWEKLPKEERDAEMKEAIKKNQQTDDLRQQIINGGGDPDSPNLHPQYREILSAASEEGGIDVLTGETTNDENVGGMYNRVTGVGGTIKTESWYNGQRVSDELVNIDEQQNAQVDSVTGYTLNNDDAASFDRFQMHHDDGIMDGYLDTAEGVFNPNAETLSPLNLDSALVTDAYQHQNAPGADLIASEPNQGMDPYQAQRVQYEVLA